MASGIKTFYQNLAKPFLLDAKKFILDTLFPIRCLVCNAEGVFICRRCLHGLKKLENQYCIICQKPSPLGFTHPGCKAPFSADGLISILNYHDKNVAEILIAGKYNFLPGVYEELGKFLAKEIRDEYPQLVSQDKQISLRPRGETNLRNGNLLNSISTSSMTIEAVNTYLVPLPLHTRRLRWRGFNQAEVLAQTIAVELHLPCTSVLVRCKPTKTQKDLKREQRIKNVKDAFVIAPSPHEGRAGDRLQIKDQNFILIDDVTTTGSTLQEAAKVLKRNGAKTVWCLTIARD